jgi:hypothetical protein
MECLNCKQTHFGGYGSGKFCSVKCARSYATKNKRIEINKKVSIKMTGKSLSESHIKNIENANNFNRKEKVSLQCTGCNNIISCSPSQKRKYCSKKCWVEYTEKNRTDYASYVKKCKFDFDVYDYSLKFNLSLIEEFGWYKASNRGNNLQGISRDHMLSISEGFKLNIDPELIKHPANCELMEHSDNAKKRTKSSITLEELKERINKW